MVPNFMELIFHWERQIISKDLSLNQGMMNKLCDPRQIVLTILCHHFLVCLRKVLKVPTSEIRCGVNELLGQSQGQGLAQGKPYLSVGSW